MQHVDSATFAGSAPASLRDRLVASDIRPLDPAIVEAHKAKMLAGAPKPTPIKNILHPLVAWYDRRFVAIHRWTFVFGPAEWGRKAFSLAQVRVWGPDSPAIYEIFDGHLYRDDCISATRVVDAARAAIPDGVVVIDELIQDEVVIDPVVLILDPNTGEEAALLIYADFRIVDMATVRSA